MRLTFFFTISLFHFLANSTTFNESLKFINKKHAIFGSAILTKNITSKTTKKKYFNLFFNNKNDKYELDIVFPTNAQDFNINKKNISSIIIKSYQDQPTPYLGEITNVVVCSKKFIPVQFQEKIGTKDVFVIKSFTGSSYNYGVCEEKMITHSACTSFYFDEKKLLYFKLRLFTKPHDSCEKLTREFFTGLSDL